MRRHRSLDFAFIGMLLIIAMGTLRLLQGDFHLQSNLLALLPEDDGASASRLASEQLSRYLGDDFIFFIKGTDVKHTVAASKEVASEITASPWFTLLSAESQFESRVAYIEMLKQHRFHLLSDHDAGELSSGDGAELLSSAIQSAYELGASASFATPAEDPLALFNRYLLSRSGNDTDGELVDGVVLLHSANATYGVLHGRARQGAFNLDVQSAMSRLEGDLGKLLAARDGSVQLLRAGMIFHASRAANSAKKEVSLIGLGSIAGIFVLFIATFRSVKPLLLSLTSIAFGCVFAFVLCGNIYGTLHLLTLVFGASLVGVTVDYSLHYLTRKQSSGAGVPGMGLAILTSVVGYGALLDTHLPGLREMAVFSIAGLIASGVFVAVVFPRVKFAPRTTGKSFMLSLARVPSRFWQRTSNTFGWGIVAVSLLALTQFTMTNDLRIFHTPDPALLDEQANIEALAPSHAANQFFLIRGASGEAVLQIAEEFKPQLDDLVARGAIGDYTLLSDALPSQQRQQANKQLLMETVYRPGAEADTYFARLNFNQKVRAEFRRSLAATQPLSPEQWLANAPAEQALMWLGQHNGAYYSIVLLTSIKDIPALQRAAAKQEEISFIDTVAAISSTLQASAVAAAQLLVWAYIAVAAVLLLRYRQLSALKLLLIPLIASMLTTAVLSLLGVSLTLFHLFALYLVLGLGMDYGIFSRESSADWQSCELAILLSALTSSLSFGLLALSSTPMIAAFGSTVMLGGLCNWFLVPLIVRKHRGQPAALT